MWRIWVVALFWGLNWPAVKIILEGVSPFALRVIGLGSATVLLAGAALATGRSLAVPRRAWGDLAVAGFLNVAVFNICAVFAQIHLPTSRAAILTFTMPLWAAVFAYFALGERIDGLRSASLTVGAAGLTLLSVPFWPALQDGRMPPGLAFVLGAAIGWAAGTVYLKRRPLPLDPLVSTVWQVAIGALVPILGVVLVETPRVELSDPRVAAALAFHILLPQSLCYLLWFTLLPKVPASTAALGTLLIPVAGVLGSVAILGDRPTVADIAGFVLILAAVATDQLLRARRRA